MFVRPAEGRAVRRPDTKRLLAKDGETVPDTAFWLRAVMRGDVEEGAPAKEAEVVSEVSPAPAEDNEIAVEPAEPVAEQQPAGEVAEGHGE